MIDNQISELRQYGSSPNKANASTNGNDDQNGRLNNDNVYIGYTDEIHDSRSSHNQCNTRSSDASEYRTDQMVACRHGISYNGDRRLADSIQSNNKGNLDDHTRTKSNSSSRILDHRILMLSFI